MDNMETGSDRPKFFADKKMNKVLVVCGAITTILIIGMIVFTLIPI